MSEPLSEEQAALLRGLSIQTPEAEPVPEGERPERSLVKVPKESRLESLLCLYEMKKAAADAAETEFKELKAGILNELRQLHPGNKEPTKAYDIAGTNLYPPLTFAYRQNGYYLPTDLIREHLPQVWEAFRKPKTYWELRRSQQ